MNSLPVRMVESARNTLLVGVALGGLALGTNKADAQEQLRIFSPKHVTADNPQGIVTGGYTAENTANYEDERSRLKTGQEQTENYKHFVNPYIAPRETKDYWGSGDADNNGTINDADAEAITAGTANYRTDIDGDGTMSTSADLNLLKKYLSGEIKYLPGHWNKLESVAERKDWAKKMIAIDNTDYFREGWNCGNYSSNLFYNMNWVEDITNWAEYNTQNRIYDFSDLGIFNLPVYIVHTTAKNGESHAVSGIFLGSDITSEDNSIKFEKWLFIEPQTDLEITPGNFSMDENKPVKVGGIVYAYSNFMNKYIWSSSNIIEWNLDNGNPTLSFQNPDLVTKRPSSSGIEDIVNPFDYDKPTITAFPNPVMSGYDLNLINNTEQFDENGKLRIFDISGKLVYEHKHLNRVGNKLIIPSYEMNGLENGLYTIQYRSTKENASVIILKRVN